MNFFRNLFGDARPAPARATPAVSPALAAEATPTVPTSDVADTTPIPKTAPTADAAPASDQMIEIFDGYGRKLQVPREEWRTNILPDQFVQHRRDPERLAGCLLAALKDGFFAESLDAARHLTRIDPNAERAACILGIVQLQLGYLEEAERTLRRYLEEHGPSGVILTNLAKVYSGRGDAALSAATLWQAIHVDPNQDNGMAWFVQLRREIGGETAAQAALEKIAALPGSWRAPVWLAHEALEKRRTAAALQWYQIALDNAPRPVPAELLQQMSGDLGNHAHIMEILKLVAPHYDVAVHGLLVGNNVLKAQLDLGHIDAARAVLDGLYAQKRPDWQEHLAYWDHAIARARIEIASPPAELPPLTLLAVHGPVWLPEQSPAAELFAAKPVDAPVVAIYAGTVERSPQAETQALQLSEGRGRMSRALGLYLTEQVHLRTEAAARFLQPWLTGPDAAFALTTHPWADDDAAAHARAGSPPASLAITFHLSTTIEPWSVTARVIRTLDASLAATLATTIDPNRCENGFQTLARDLLAALKTHEDIQRVPESPAYCVPPGAAFAFYQLRLEQCLAVAVANGPDAPVDFLGGEREIIDGMIQLALDEPQNITHRILLAQTLTRLKKTRPAIPAEFSERIALLQKEMPLAMPAQGVLQRMFDAAFA